MLDHLKIAVISLKERKVRSWLTLLGIFIGIAAVVALIGLGDGLRTAITSQFGVTSTEVLTVQAGGVTGAGPPGTGVSTPLTIEDVDAIERLSNVDFAVDRIIETVPIEYNGYLDINFAMSMPDGEKRKFGEELLDVQPESGRLLNDGDTNKVMIGHNYAYNPRRFGGKEIVVGKSLIIKGREFEVVGILKKRGSFIVDNTLFINDAPLRELSGNKDKVDLIGVKVKDMDIIDEAKADVEKLLRQRRDVKEGEEDFVVQTPAAMLSSLNQILSGVQIFIVIIASISILVGAIGIVNTMLTAILERRSQIGIMKAVGARNSDIFKIFFFESGLLGLIGGIIGVIIGSLLSYFGTLAINSFVGSTTAPQISFMLIFGALLGSFIIGSVAGIVPAMRAARENPVDSLRG